MTNSTETSAIMQTYNRFPVTVIKGKGSYVWDDVGNVYLDFTSGIATCNLGHVPDTVKEAVSNQLEQLWHCSNLYHIPSQETLANLLTAYSCFDQVFFCNSGAEANEAAIKLIRSYNTTNKNIVTFEKSFHGRTMGTASATGQEKIQKGFEPLLSGFTHLTYNDYESLTFLANNPPAAVMLELVQGEGGVIPAEQAWINELVRICREKGILIAVDEVQTGLGRTGSLFAYEDYGFEPDILTTAKGLGSGFPIGSMLAKTNVAKAFGPGSHASTFGGNPLATTAGVATMKQLTSPSLLENVNRQSDILFSKLTELKEAYPQIKTIRGKGLLVGIELTDGAGEIVKEAINQKLLILTAGANVLRILPPLTVTTTELDKFIDKLQQVLEAVYGSYSK
ncbi:acetylornithine transaminase [Lentibacillus cibarius]|nr:acetylornithine transaminase [Lentibacillus cibarius]